MSKEFIDCLPGSIFSSQNRNERAVCRLFEAGAYVTQPLNDCLTALIVASRNAYQRIVGLLLEAGADVWQA